MTMAPTVGAPLLLLFIAAASSLPLPSPTSEHAAAFLAKYGYMYYNPGSGVSHDKLVAALRRFQTFVGLNQTGRLDNDTVTKMNKPRCGVKDMEFLGSRQKRFSVHGSRWTKRHLTYTISKYSERLSHKEVDEVIGNAFLTWSESSTLTFSQRPFGPVDIDIRFEVGEHGDGKNSSFDGPGGSLAHAFFPAFGGAAHFDDAESWSLSDEGTNLFSVAIHELGHSLGLHHTDVPEAVMSPYYQYNDFGLHPDDEEGIQALYPHKYPGVLKHGHDHTHNHEIFKPISGQKFAQNLKDCPDLCSDPSIDTIFTSTYMKTYVFKGEYYWELLKGKLAHWHARRINETWRGLPGGIDAAFTYSDGRTYFFKGNKYWSYIGRVKEHGFPKNISEELPGIPSNIDAAMVWGVNGKLYFFKGSEFWRYDPNSKVQPKPISSHWGSIPTNLDAVYSSPGGSTYFIKGNQFYKFDNFEFDVATGDPPYPRNLTEFVYDCWPGDY